MPIYGEAKTRNMIRSVLPSTHRKGARDDKRHAYGSERQQTRQVLGRIRCIEDADESEDNEFVNCNQRIKDAMWDRRNGDKLGPLLRWGPEITKHIPVEDRADYLRPLLNKTPMGRHAYGHLVGSREIPDPTDPYPWWLRYGDRQKERQASWEADNKWLRWFIGRLLDCGGEHKQFNRWVKSKAIYDYKAKVYVPRGRPFLGASDTDDYVTYVLGTYPSDGSRFRYGAKKPMGRNFTLKDLKDYAVYRGLV